MGGGGGAEEAMRGGLGCKQVRGSGQSVSVPLIRYVGVVGLDPIRVVMLNPLWGSRRNAALNSWL